MTHKIGRIRRRVRRAGPAPGRGAGAARAAMLAENLQAKLKVGPQNDAFEREADSVADRVMGGHAVAPAASHSEGAMQRKCEECETEDAQRMPQQRKPEEEEEQVQTKRLAEVQRKGDEEEEEMVRAKRLDGDVERQADEEEEETVQSKTRPDGSFTAGAAVSAQVAGLKGGGQGLSTATRSYFEPRFGADFSDVRVHTGPQAQTAAKALNARAFTTGRDVVFGPGEYAPATRKGGELLAHELTHVIQQRDYKRSPGGKSGNASVQRWQIGAAPVPAAFPSGKLVPQGAPKGTEDHRKRLSDARAIVARLLGSTRCVNYFKDKCEGGTDTTLKDTFDNARIYFMDMGGTTFAATPPGTSDIAYNRTTYGQGKWFLASSLLHEMYHVCAPNAPALDAEFDAESAVETCRLYTPYLHSITPSSGAVGSEVSILGANFGPTRGKHDRVELNGVECPIKSWTFARSSSGVTIVVTIPPGAKSGSLRVINNEVKSRHAKFTVI